MVTVLSGYLSSCEGLGWRREFFSEKFQKSPASVLACAFNWWDLDLVFWSYDDGS